jgi:hypothetical protein
MLTSSICIEKFGEPTVKMEYKFMKVWDIPDDINKEIPALPNRVYCHNKIIIPLEKAFRNIIERKLQKEVRTWDGCFNIRNKRGLKSWSIHAWGLAIDINAAWNGLGKVPTMSKELVKCFTDAGFDWGGVWKRKDGMHFQLSIKLIK